MGLAGLKALRRRDSDSCGTMDELLVIDGPCWCVSSATCSFALLALVIALVAMQANPSTIKNETSASAIRVLREDSRAHGSSHAQGAGWVSFFFTN